ncbi:LruC domain-containing protein [Polaribacter sp. Hel1_33_78]|uniref:LruC domain-containing protein n=1 Tax=Polaribacter sp. Hel1_33_78 TaxID=1336804 RepID=UPI00087B8EE9|nr:LruC domain-containing protein [Polaribacter sp. Hel1_33_78]SDU22206.1 LruC domain-containing protein [Polaribacter sp. Hel1_33_78]
MKKFNIYFLISFLIIFSSCIPNDVDMQEPETVEVSENAIQVLENLDIPNGFNFETERDVILTIIDATPFVKYEVFAYSSDYDSEAENISEALKSLLYAGKPYNGIVNHVLSLSSVYDKVYISRKDGLEYSYEIIDVLNNKIDFTITASKTANKTARAYKVSSTGCVECTENVFINGDFEDGPALPRSYIQPQESFVDGWSTTATDNRIELWKSGFLGVPALNGRYFAELNATQNSALYQRICTSPGAEISWSVWHRGRAGTDTAVVRIGENLATATIETTMTTGNTAWVKYSGTYTVPFGQDDTYFIFEAVNTAGSISVGNFIDNVVITETLAGDCAEVTNKMFYPNEFTNATIAFEDLWPYSGDYDFNDLVISYNIKTILNAENNVTQVDYNYIVESIGAGYKNGFGLELEGVSPSAISSVTGSNLTEGIITNNANGTEQAQPNAVIIFFDNAHLNVGLPNTISIVFENPITTAALGNAPFNPFLIANMNRLKEVHLPNKPTTYYPTTVSIEEGPTVRDSDGNFKTPEGFPWAMNINGKYKAPKEKVIITEAYNFFANWATSGGTSYPDWYQNKRGYRNNANLKN